MIRAKRLIGIILIGLLAFGLTGCSLEDDTEIDMFGLYDNVLPEELKNINPDELTQEQLLEIIDNLSVDKDIKQMEDYLGFSFMDFMKQVAENPIDESLIKGHENYMTFQEAANVLKEYNFDINALNLEHPDEMTIDDITKAVTGYSIKKGFESWGPGGVEIYNTLENMYSNIVDDTKKSFSDGMDAIKNAVGKKTNKNGEEITEADILAYIESELVKQGYTPEGSQKVIKETLEAISEEMDGDQKKALDIFITATDGMLGMDTDLKDEDITEEEKENARNILNSMLDNVGDELTPEQQAVLNMFKEAGEFFATYDYRSGDAQGFTDGILDTIGNTMNMTEDQKALIEMFKSML